MRLTNSACHRQALGFGRTTLRHGDCTGCSLAGFTRSLFDKGLHFHRMRSPAVSSLFVTVSIER